MNRRKAIQPFHDTLAERFLGSVCLMTMGALFVLMIDFLARV